MEEKVGHIVGVNGNVITVHLDTPVIQNEVGFALIGELRLKAEVIRVRGSNAEMQVFEDTTGLRIGDSVEFTSELLSVELGPGLLSQIFDGLQNPLPKLAEQCGFFLQRGIYLPPLSRETRWDFTAIAQAGQRVRAGDVLGTVPEGIFTHKIMVPFKFSEALYLEEIVISNSYTIDQPIAKLRDESGVLHSVSMVQTWPVKIPIKAYKERLRPSDPLVTRVRIVDTLFPVARGGTYCIPGPFGTGKTVLQQIVSRYADVDIVIIAACGERAGEVVETLLEFPQLTDPRTGRNLMERTLIICNTSSMPVAAREASVYTAVTIAEYYRQMGLNVLLLADSTSRWAQALREVSGRLEEIPGEEAFPAYLESVIAAFYERGGVVKLNDNSLGSVTIGGTVSPAGGNFEEPVTQSTLKVVGAFHGLSNTRADARRYPAIDPLESWSKYSSIVPEELVQIAFKTMRHGNDVNQMMKVVGEEGTVLGDFIEYLKAEYMDNAYLQQDAYHPIDAATSAERQKLVFSKIIKVLQAQLSFSSKNDARLFFQQLTQLTKDWNRVALEDPAFQAIETRIDDLLLEATTNA